MKRKAQDNSKKKKWQQELEQIQDDGEIGVEAIQLPEDYGKDSEDEEYDKRKKLEEQRQEEILVKEKEDLAKQQQAELDKQKEHLAKIEKEDKNEEEKVDVEDPELRSIFIVGLPKKFSDADLSKLCSEFGKIRSYDLIRIEGAEKNKGKALVEYYNTMSAMKAKQALDGKDHNGKFLIVNIGLKQA
mmetsp:Transcript_292/g.294  ORF Transcript_292/g.294 Transcript_292/m.294 type:complete len:187 (+) Transcript_292:5-565(+)|eukprot:CAMPEP_0168340634 /NCGR_PEP_ID=MMETSP0213-20121227/14178_1 /TAXON_ID=151035 /ORGANISM="Euplotes harpa, Strain FSP1.4" /LENGTH=186 /DNA_ID=CAMNT_0008346903 /DNA_START=1 /DNA_END=561 /DNA_ORIENTATION=-